MKHILLSSEKILPDNYPIYYGYIYIGDMKFMVNDILMRGTVRDLKRTYKLTEIRSCNIVGHSFAKIGDKLI